MGRHSWFDAGFYRQRDRGFQSVACPTKQCSGLAIKSNGVVRVRSRAADCDRYARPQKRRTDIDALSSALALGLPLVQVIVVFCLNAGIHLAFAVSVWSDAAQLPPSRRSALVAPFVWFLATLLGGPLMAGLYWLMHHSAIAPDGYWQSKTKLAGDPEEQ